MSDSFPQCFNAEGMTLPAELAVAVWLEVGQLSELADGDGRAGKTGSLHL